MISRSSRIGAALAVLVAAGAAAETAVIPASHDNTMYEDAAGALSNGSGDAIYVGDNAQLNTRRGLVRFAVDAALPAGAIVTSAELRLAVVSAADAGTRTVGVHRALAEWGEGASSSGGRGAPAAPGDATWLHRFYPDSAWVAAGGDFDPAPLATAPVGESGTVIWSGPAVTAAVQVWLDDPAANHGWLLQGEEGTPQTARSFHSRESPDGPSRPALVVEWTLPTAVSPGAWAHTKAAFRGSAGGD